MACWSKWTCFAQAMMLLLLCWQSMLPSANSQEDMSYTIRVNIMQNDSEEYVYQFRPAEFGARIYNVEQGAVVHAIPQNACSSVQPRGNCDMSTESKCFLLIDDDREDDCDFGLKAHMAETKGYDAAIISNTVNNQLYAIDAKEYHNDISIPVIYVGKDAGVNMGRCDDSVRCTVTIYGPPLLNLEFYIIPFAIIVGICFVLMAMFMISRYYQHYLEQRRNRISPANLRKIPIKKFKKGDDYYDLCAICLDEYKDGDRLRILPCQHAYHCKCVDPWLTEGKRTCPVCKRPVETGARPDRRRRQRENVENGAADEGDSAPDETTPLIVSSSPADSSHTNTVTA